MAEFLLFFKVKWFLFQEGRVVRRLFPSFLKYERALKKAYRFSNPFQICKNYLKQRGEQLIHAYGETPLPVLATIAKQCEFNPKDIIIELGCGRGRGAFFLSQLIGCRVIGIDWVPFFIKTAKAIAASFGSPLPVRFDCQEMQVADLSEATVIYLYGTCLSDEAIYNLISRFEKLSAGVKIVTVSYPLFDYNPRFCTIKQFTVTFPWGDAEVYLNQMS